MTQSFAGSSVRVRVVESEAEFAALAADWESLQKDAVAGGVFESFDWQHLWWKSYGQGHALRLLLATVDGVLVGILPLYIQTQRMLGYPVSLLRFVGTGGDTFPDDLGPVLAAHRKDDVARALADEVMRLPGWDVLLLTDMDPACAFTAALESAVRRERLDCRTGRCERIAYVDLPQSWDAWLQSLHRDRRYRIRNARKKLHAAHPARFFVWNDPDTLDTAVNRLIHLHHKRWNSVGVGMTNAFSSPQYIHFHRSVMAACLERDRLRLYCLEMSGQIAAMFYFYKFRDRVYLMQSGFDPDHANLKPGQVLLGHIVEHAIGEGHKVLDFLRGDHRYKDELASGERETVHVTAFRLRPGALVYRTRRHILPVVKAQLKRVVGRLRPSQAKAE